MKFKLSEYERRVAALLDKAGARREVFAEVDGHTLSAYDLVRGDRPKVFISTGMHGDESAGPKSFLFLLENGLLERDLSFYFCPMLNPTGFELGTRENAQGCDMNRDYFHLQTAEVQGHVKWLEKRRPELFISLHEDWESSGFYFYEINTFGDRPERYAYLSERISEVMPLEQGEFIDGHEVREQGWIYHEAEADMNDSWPEAIFMAKRGCALSFTFESPSMVDVGKRVAAQAAAVNALLDFEYGER